MPPPGRDSPAAVPTRAVTASVLSLAFLEAFWVPQGVLADPLQPPDDFCFLYGPQPVLKGHEGTLGPEYTRCRPDPPRTSPPSPPPSSFAFLGLLLPPQKVNFLSLTTAGFGCDTLSHPACTPSTEGLPHGAGGACVAPLPSQEARAPLPFAQMATGR